MPWQSKLKSSTWITKKRKRTPSFPRNCQGLHYGKSLLKITKLWCIFVFFNKWWQRTVLQWQNIQLLLTWYSMWCKDIWKWDWLLNCVYSFYDPIKSHCFLPIYLNLILRVLIMNSNYFQTYPQFGNIFKKLFLSSFWKYPWSATYILVNEFNPEYNCG